MEGRHRGVIAGAAMTLLFFVAGWYLLGYNVLSIFAQMGQLGWIAPLQIPLVTWVVLETLATFFFALFLFILLRKSRRARSLEGALAEEREERDEHRLRGGPRRF